MILYNLSFFSWFFIVFLQRSTKVFQKLFIRLFLYLHHQFGVYILLIHRLVALILTDFFHQLYLDEFKKLCPNILQMSRLRIQNLYSYQYSYFLISLHLFVQLHLLRPQMLHLILALNC
ncbi:hypothetical protein HMPREF9281_00202 [Staphylococcus epidermidis BVS058A4]|nr:hypothetical protein HMPREF9281_00202 [Staphylococcus epidermidis BVS058A4]